MAKPESSDLIAHIKLGTIEDYRKKEKEKLASEISMETIKEDLMKIQNEWEGLEDGYLKEGIRSAFVGAMYGLKDRELDPFHKDHFPIFKSIRDDIEEAFEIVNEGELDEELWLFETFDYGIKNIYYLDWQLYLSKICY